MIDKGATYDNVRGVFADLDDGGLTDDEALLQIRALVGAKLQITTLVMTGVIPFTITVDLTDKTVTEFEVNYESPTYNQLVETRITGDEIDPDMYDDEIEEAKKIAEECEWPEPVRM